MRGTDTGRATASSLLLAFSWTAYYYDPHF
jgi:hypothetical protein